MHQAKLAARETERRANATADHRQSTSL
jgi:hypothetical protein